MRRYRIALGFLMTAGLALAEKPVTLMPGLGVWHHPIATSSPQAQKFFDQGLALLYGFNRYEALRSFRKVVELDPKAAMGYWGEAMSLGPYVNMDGDPTFDIKSSCAAINAGRLVTGAPEREKAWLAAVSAWCPDYKDPQAYANAMRALTARYPDDLDALTIYAESLMIPVRWRWYAADGTPAPGVRDAEHALEEVLRRWPQHPGANHYYIHAVESSQNPERAVPSAQRLMGIIPAAGHMVHMPGHIWLVLGEWDLAASVNERAVTVDQRYFDDTDMHGGSYSGYYIHNIHFVAYARSMQGRKGDTLKAAALMNAELAPMAKTMPEMVQAFSTIPLFMSLRFNDWEGILKLPAADAGMPVQALFLHFARALALAAKGRPAEAEVEAAAFGKAAAGIPADTGWGTLNHLGDVTKMGSEILAARLAKTPAEAVPHWRQAVAQQDALIYDEPPAWYYPLRESLGAALLRAGDAAGAEKVFRDGVRLSPRNGRMLFGLWQSLKAQGKTDDAAWVQREFEAAWAKADIKLRIEDL
jgi:tetratricopeptide (TPR) repeat protein